MPGRCFQVSMRLRSSGLSSGNQPRMQNLSGYFFAASTAISLEPASQLGGCSTAPFTPAASISLISSSAV